MRATLRQLKSRLERLLSGATAFNGVGYRSSTPEYATKADLLTGEGSKLHGGRWNPVGIAAVYASLTPETAMSESLANNRYYGIALEDAMPRTFVAIEANLHAVLDFRDGSMRRRLQVSEERILVVDWRRDMRAGHDPITHLIGRAAYEVGWEGLIVPSAVDRKGHNLLVFPEKLQPRSRLLILHPGCLRT